MKSTFTRTLPVLCAFGLAACAETSYGPATTAVAPVYHPGMGDAFNEADFAWSRAAGAGAIDGIVTFHDGATRYSCRGRDVILTPETPWVRRRMYILYGSVSGAVVPAEIVRARTPGGSSGDYASYARKTTCDGANRFSFRGLASGGWYVITVARPDDVSQGSVAIMRRVQVNGGDTRVDLD